MPDFSASPINYAQDIATPFQAAMQGYAGGAQIRNDQQAQVQQQQAMQAQQQSQQMLTQLANNPNATGDDYARVMTAMPQFAEPLTKAWTTKNAAQQQAALSDGLQWGSAIQSGHPEVAADLMNTKADAMEKAAGGPTADSQALRVHAQIAVAHPQFALGQLQAWLFSNPNADQAAKARAAFGSEDRAQAQAPAALDKANAEASSAVSKATIEGATVPAQIEKPALDNANTRSQIAQRSNQYGLDRDKLTTETQLALKKMGMEYGQLPTAVGDQVTAAVTESIASEQSAGRMTDLATRLDAEGGGYGVASSAGEWIKKATGNQNEMTRLRAEYNRIATPAAMAAYKKVASGSTSDKDIETAMVGVPKDNADAATMAAFLRGAAKLQVYDSVMSNAKSEWLGAVRSLGKPSADIEIDGVKVPAGTTFKAFFDQYVPQKVAGKLVVQHIKTAPYGVWANPPPGQ